jgi:uncharacterized membrane protein
MISRLFWRICTPSVSRDWLLLVAGAEWSIVGIALCIVAAHWLSGTPWPAGGIGATIGFGFGFIVYKFGFSRIAGKNIDRIAQKPDKACFFAFQGWQSYLLILVMILLGYTLRHSHLPRMAVSIIYLVIGTALALSSSLYYDRFF